MYNKSVSDLNKNSSLRTKHMRVNTLSDFGNPRAFYSQTKSTKDPEIDLEKNHSDEITENHKRSSDGKILKENLIDKLGDISADSSENREDEVLDSIEKYYTSKNGLRYVNNVGNKSYFGRRSLSNKDERECSSTEKKSPIRKNDNFNQNKVFSRAVT